MAERVEHSQSFKRTMSLPGHMNEGIMGLFIGSKHCVIDQSRFYREFSNHKTIGEGASGKVHRVTSRLDRKDYAIKRVRFLFPPQAVEKEEWMAQTVLKETQFLARMDHPNIVRYYQSWIEHWGLTATSELTNLVDVEGEFVSPPQSETPTERPKRSNSDAFTVNSTEHRQSFELSREVSTTFIRPDELQNFSIFNSPTKTVRGDRSDSDSEIDEELPPYVFEVTLCIQMAYYPDQTLKDWIVSQRCIERDSNMSIFVQILRGLNYVHESGLVHRDLKPLNIFAQKGKSGAIQIRIGDFGLSSDAADGGNSTGGTLQYASPEQLAEEMCDSHADIYSLGLILAEMYLGQFETESEKMLLWTRLRNGDLPQEFEELYREEARLVRWMIAPEPWLRPDCWELLEDPFVGGRGMGELISPGSSVTMASLGIFHQDTASMQEYISRSAQDTINEKDWKIARLKSMIQKRDKLIAKLQCLLPTGVVSPDFSSDEDSDIDFTSASDSEEFTVA